MLQMKSICESLPSLSCSVLIVPRFQERKSVTVILIGFAIETDNLHTVITLPVQFFV